MSTKETTIQLTSANHNVKLLTENAEMNIVTFRQQATTIYQSITNFHRTEYQQQQHQISPSINWMLQTSKFWNSKKYIFQDRQVLPNVIIISRDKEYSWNIQQLTKMDLQTLATAWHECVVGKSSGRFGRLRIFISGTRPFCVTNSRQWSSVVLLLSIASTNFIYMNTATSRNFSCCIINKKYYITIPEKTAKLSHW